MNKLAGVFKSMMTAAPLVVVLLMPRYAEAAIVEFNLNVFVDYEGDPDVDECLSEPVDTFYCIPDIAVGDRVGLTFAVDTASRVEPPEGYYEWWGAEPFVWGTFGLWSTTIQTAGGPFTPHFGLGREGNGLPIFSVEDGAVDIFRIYSPTTHDSESGGGTSITLRDSTGTAISAADLASAAAFEYWAVNTFSASLFDSGSWYLSTFDGGGGAGGSIDVTTEVPEPSTIVLLLAGLAMVACFRRPKARARGLALS
jgi:hypothetical protein